MRKKSTTWVLNNLDSAEAVLATAQVESDGIFSASFLTRRAISIVDQQRRSFNLCYALCKSRRINAHSHVAIVGGGISGMTCAVALAIKTGCIVYVFERDSVLLRRFREAPFRFIHPQLNDGATEQANRYNDRDVSTDFPFMNWSGDFAPAFAEKLARKFDHYRSWSSIALYLNHEVKSVEKRGKRIEVELKNSQIKSPRQVHKFDCVILATGFGDERDDGATRDASYWHSGNPTQYRPSVLFSRAKQKEKVLISGNGDSAIVELAHFLIRDFRHDEIFYLLPTNDNARSLAIGFTNAVNSLIHRQIEAIDEDYPDVPAPVGWYWRRRLLSEMNDTYSIQEGAALFDILDKHLRRFAVEANIPSEILKAALVELEPILDEFASDEILSLVRNYNLSSIVSPQLVGRFQDVFRMTMIGRTPNAYSRRQAPINWFLLRALEKFGSFSYRRATVQGAELWGQKTRVTLKLSRNKIKREDFDRIVVRHGADFSSLGYHWKSREIIFGPRNSVTPYWVDFDENFFRNGRWKRIVEQKLPLFDPEPRSYVSLDPNGRIGIDGVLLLFSQFNLQQIISAEFKRFKNSTSEKQANSALKAIGGKVLSHLREKLPETDYLRKLTSP